MPSTAVILGATIRSGDIVKIKWKPLSDIFLLYRKNGYNISNFVSESNIGDHIAIFSSDSYFKVNNVNSGDLYRYCPQFDKFKYLSYDKLPHEIEIIDHLSNGDTFFVNENYIDSIEVVHEVGERYFSDKFNISIIKIDGALFINGELVTKEDIDLISILEGAISDLAIQKIFNNSTEE